MQKLENKKGFTLVELSLSVAFIAILSITIALIINDAVVTYRRGLTLNQINTVGMDLVDDMRAAIQNSPANIANSCEEGEGYMDCSAKYVSVTGVASEVEVGGKSIGENVPVYGAFCTGSYSYIWNSGYFFANDTEVFPNSQAQLNIGEEGSETITDFRLLKVKDKRRAICSTKTEDDNIFRIEGENNEDFAVELISADAGSGLALYDLSVPLPAISDAKKTTFYSVSFVLGTVQGGINVMSSGNFCKAPESDNSAANFDYCAINKFNFAAQANGG